MVLGFLADWIHMPHLFRMDCFVYHNSIVIALAPFFGCSCSRLPPASNCPKTHFSSGGAVFVINPHTIQWQILSWAHNSSFFELIPRFFSMLTILLLPSFQSLQVLDFFFAMSLSALTEHRFTHHTSSVLHICIVRFAQSPEEIFKFVAH